MFWKPFLTSAALPTRTAGTPQSFNVLMKEIQGLCLNIRPENKEIL